MVRGRIPLFIFALRTVPRASRKELGKCEVPDCSGGCGLRAAPLLTRKQLEDVAAGRTAGAVAFCTCRSLHWLCMKQGRKRSACRRGRLPTPRQGHPYLLRLNQVLRSSVRSLRARPTETDTPQGEGHDREHRPGTRFLFPVLP